MHGGLKFWKIPKKGGGGGEQKFYFRGVGGRKTKTKNSIQFNSNLFSTIYTIQYKYTL